MIPPSRLPDIEARAARRCCVFVTGATAMTIATGALIGAGTGAALGAGTAALSGGDVGKGALFGGLGGTLTGGVMSGIGAAGGAAAGAGTGGTGGAGLGAGAGSGGMGFAGVSGGSGLTAAPGIGASGAAQMGQQAMTSGGNAIAQTAPGMGMSGIGGWGTGAASPATTATQLGQEAMAQEAVAQATKEAGMSSFEKGLSHFTTGLKNMPDKIGTWAGENPLQAIGFLGQGINALTQNNDSYEAPVQAQQPTAAWGLSPNYQPSRPTAYRPKLGYAEGGPVNKFYAAGLQQAQQQAPQAQPMQSPQVQPMQPLQPQPLPQAQQGIAGYARGRMVEGPGDGVSDGIEALIDGHRPAALATSEYVIPARIVSELGNGSSSAGAKRLDQMVKNVQHKRKATMGKKGIAIDSKAYRALPA